MIQRLSWVELDAVAQRLPAGLQQRTSQRAEDIVRAALKYLAERHGIDTIFTLDRRDFSVYRVSGGRALPMAPAL